MRIANLAGRLVILTSENQGIDVHAASDSVFESDPQLIYDRWVEFRTWANSLDLSMSGPPRVAVTADALGPPAPMPRQVFAIGANYATHVSETGRDTPGDLVVFTKFPTCLVGPQDHVQIPSTHTDWEVELAVVIGARARHVDEADAWAYVAGLTIGQDISERILQRTGARSQYCMAKSMPTFGPIGPCVVTPDEFPNPDDLRLSCTLNGESMQDGRTSDMIFSVSQILARLSKLCILLPGDVIFTGTPSGVGSLRTPPRFLAPGDVLVSTIEHLGEMTNTCVAADVELEYR